MIYKLLTAGAVAAALLAVTPAAWAAGADKDGQFYATPIQKGAPRDLPGERLIPGADIAVNVIDGVTRPLIVDPIQGAGAAIGDPLAPLAGPAPAAAPAKRRVGAHKRHHVAGHKSHGRRVAAARHKGKKA